MLKFQQQLARSIFELRQWSSNQKVSTFDKLYESNFLPPSLVFDPSVGHLSYPQKNQNSLFLGTEVFRSKKVGKKPEGVKNCDLKSMDLQLSFEQKIIKKTLKLAEIGSFELRAKKRVFFSKKKTKPRKNPTHPLPCLENHIWKC